MTNQLELCYHDLTVLFNALNSNAYANGAGPIGAQGQQADGSDSPSVLMKKEAVQELVNQLFSQHHVKKQLILLRLITKLANSKLIDVRYTCEFMLNNLVYYNPNNDSIHGPNGPASNVNFQVNHNMQHLHWLQKAGPAAALHKNTSTYLWYKILECVRKFIPHHDYKTCRDILKILLELVKRMPHSNSSYPSQLEADTLVRTNVAAPKRTYNESLDSLTQQQQQQLASSFTNDIKLESLFEVGFNHKLKRTTEQLLMK